MTPAVIAMDTPELPIYEINSADLKGISKFTSIPGSGKNDPWRPK